MKLLTTLFLILTSSQLPSASAAGPTAAELEKLGAQVRVTGGKIVEIKADCDKLGDDGYRMMGKVTSLTSLSLSGKAMSDDQLAMLSALKNLESILLNGTELSDNGYRHFAAFTKLKRLSLFHPSRNVHNFTGAGLAHLKALPNLERLTFAGATAGDAAFKAVAEIQQLKEFSQWHNLESPQAIEHLTKLPHLRALKIGQRLPSRGRPLTPSFDNETLSVIARMKTLEKLDLQEARLSLAGLKHLQSLSNLRELKLQWIDVPAADVEQLQKLLPNVKINLEPMTDEERESTLTKKLKL
jgi:hypothetical protein